MNHISDFYCFCTIILLYYDILSSRATKWNAFSWLLNFFHQLHPKNLEHQLYRPREKNIELISNSVKAPTNEETLLRKHCFLKYFLGVQTSRKQKNCFAFLLCKRGNICRGSKFCLLHLCANGENNASATMFPWHCVSSFAVAFRNRNS